MNDYIKLGLCRSVHGIKGEMSFTLFNKDESILREGISLLLKPLDGSSLKKETLFTIEKIRFGNKVIASFKEVFDRNLAEEMIPFEFFVHRDDFPKLQDDEFYLGDLAGCKVFHFENSHEIGVIETFYENGSQDIIVIRTQRGRFEIPLVDQFVKEIDIENKVVRIIPPTYI